MTREEQIREASIDYQFQPNRNAYNGDWVPDWKSLDEIKHVIEFENGKRLF